VVEVGTTNRTRLRDYQRAMAAPGEGEAGIVLRVHQSNFRSVGFVEDVDIADLCGLGVPVIDDIGSGVIGGADAMAVLADEPTAARSVAAGAALVCFSGDKLLGGPQAGLIVGRRAAVERARAHALARALRIDKLSLAALEATLMLYRDPELALQEIPVLAMLAADEAELACRAQRLAEGIGDRSAQVIRSTARVGGGALPLAELDGPAVALSGHLDADAVAAALRGAEPPVIARIHDGRLLLDPRTVRDDELDHVVAAVRAAAHL
jgi:L-seryl-tRNA(Ser) seleniumtransferase